MGIEKVRYTHADMIDFIVANPHVSQGELAARYGYTQAWVSQIMSSDAWRAAMEARKEEIVDPVLKLTVEERFRGLAARSLDRLMQKLDAPQVSDNLVLKAVELGAKAIGVGGNAPPPSAPSADHFTLLAKRLEALNANVSRPLIPQGVIDVEAQVVPAR